MDVTRAELRACAVNEWQDDVDPRLITAIDTVDLNAVHTFDGDLTDVDETTCDDVTLVVLALDYFYGIGAYIVP